MTVVENVVKTSRRHDTEPIGVRLGWDLVTLSDIILILVKAFGEHLCTVNRGGVIVEETTPLRVLHEMFGRTLDWLAVIIRSKWKSAKAVVFFPVSPHTSPRIFLSFEHRRNYYNFPSFSVKCSVERRLSFSSLRILSKPQCGYVWTEKH